jgi:rSAM/selenodomain-associated transferase 2
MRLSIIVPTLNEASIIPHSLRALQSLRLRGHELIVVDGGSVDGTPALCQGLVDRLKICAPGRAPQMNAGAAIAEGDILLFLHADTILPQDPDRLIAEALSDSGRNWGYFRTRLSGSAPIFRLIETMMNLRTRLTGIATGDLALFVRRSLFATVGGFPPIALMEDIALSKSLKKSGWPVEVHERVTTSSRYWETRGPIASIWKMWHLRLAYFLGVDPATLAKSYYGDRH